MEPQVVTTYLLERTYMCHTLIAFSKKKLKEFIFNYIHTYKVRIMETGSKTRAF